MAQFQLAGENIVFSRILRASLPIEINASAEAVWSVLIDLENYGEWNPFTPKIKSELTVGSPVDLHVRLRERTSTDDKLYTRREWVTAVEKPLKLAWGTKVIFSFLLQAEKEQLVTPIDQNSCSYDTIDKFSGLLYPIIALFYKKRIERGFDETAAALKERCERLYPATEREANRSPGS